jgi:hypothetical protein
MSHNNLNKPWLNSLVALIFLLFAAVQYNDPDPFRWMMVYGGVSVVYILAIFGKYNRPIVWLGIAAIVIWMGLLLPDFWNWVKIGSPNIAGQMKAETPYIEFTREFFGLMLAGLALAWQQFYFRKK